MSLWHSFAWITLDTLCQTHWTQWWRLCFISRVSVFIITLLITRNCDWILPPFWLRLFRILLLCFGLPWKNLPQILLGVWLSLPQELWIGSWVSLVPGFLLETIASIWESQHSEDSLQADTAASLPWAMVEPKWLHCCGLWAKLPHSKAELQLNSLLKSSSSLDLWTLFRATSIIAYV